MAGRSYADASAAAGGGVAPARVVCVWCLLLQGCVRAVCVLRLCVCVCVCVRVCLSIYVYACTNTYVCHIRMYVTYVCMYASHT